MEQNEELDLIKFLFAGDTLPNIDQPLDVDEDPFEREDLIEWPYGDFYE